MKKFIYIVCFSILILGCEKNVIGDFGASELPAETDPTATDAIMKKGVAYTNKAKDWSYKTSDSKAFWMYSWGNDLKEEVPENVEYVPMFWGKGSVTEANLTRIKGLIDEGKVKYVLGFNEPDGANQANMTVDEAIALWPQLETLGVPLGSPATVSPDNSWMQEFMQRADAEGLRVDFVTVHSYGGANVLNFISKLKYAHDNYGGRPVWVTEFAVADWNATTVENNKYSEAQVIEFMQDATTAMNNLEWVHRYAWFDGGGRPALASSTLFDDESNLTALGQVYAAINPNNDIGPGQDTQYTPPVDENEILVNGNFETGQIAPWGGFKNGIFAADAYVGNFSGKIENGDGSLFQLAPVEAGKTYILKFASKWRDNLSTNVLKPVIRDNDAGLLFQLDPVSTTDQWTETSYEFVVPAGTSTLKIVFYKVNGNPPFYLDEVSLQEKI
ncbi:glycosyl hydrolase [Gaetbulibacter aestuarii]|uniref:Glycosyl hydrolase n=1 Tax=Gaetbulibacter aestuarii TaxID=1502358 RepID=A0ABW7MZS6_9FLAO